MRSPDWWWELRHARLELIEHDVTGRGLVASGTPHIDTVSLRQMRRAEFAATERLRADNRAWLGPWEATVPTGYPTEVPDFSTLCRRARHLQRVGVLLPFVVVANSRIVGHVSVSEITRGACHSAAVGYWVSEDMAGRGLMTLAVAMTLDCAFVEMGLHRIEINVRPHNAASLALVRRLGLREEGRRVRYLHVGGEWADHLSFAVTAEEFPDGGFVAARERARGR